MLCIFLYSQGWSLGGSSWLLLHVRVFGLRCFDDISEFSRGIVDYILFEYLELRLACFIHQIGMVEVPSYLSSLGRFSRHRFITVPRPAPFTSLRGDSTVYWGIRPWNLLPSGQFSTSSASSTLLNNLIENTYFLFS
jgi:hypothetical protein